MKKCGLSLVEDYGSDSDEEPPLKKVCILPLPGSIKSLFNEEDVDNEDDPSLHDFRVRTFAHVRGNWATYIYIDVPLEGLHGLQQSFIQGLNDSGIEVHSINEPHVSVSKVVTLQHHWINPFVSQLTSAMSTVHNLRLAWHSQLGVMANEPETRTFLTLGVTCKDLSCSVVNAVDKILAGYGQESFYDPPCFHASLAWCLGDRRKDMQAVCASRLNSTLSDAFDAQDLESTWIVRNIRCKVGHKLFTIDLDD